MAEEVAKQLESIQQSSSKVNSLIGEIAAASKEQAQGIDQVNTAVAEMDKVVQQNAADSEESASAAEELSSQAEEMERMVGELSALVGGANSKDGHKGGQKSARYGGSAKALPRKAANQKSGQGSAKGPSSQTARTNNAEQVIPLDDKDFQDF